MRLREVQDRKRCVQECARKLYQRESWDVKKNPILIQSLETKKWELKIKRDLIMKQN